MSIKKIKVNMNKPVYLGLSILEISKTLICEFWYNFIQPKFQCSPKLSYMDADSFIIHIKTEDVYEDIAYDIKKALIHPIMGSPDYSLQEQIEKQLY